MQKLEEIRSKMSRVAFNTIKLAGVLIGVVLALYCVVRCASYVVPFLIALVIAALVEPVVRLMGRMRIGRSVASLVAVLLVVAILVGIVGLISMKVFVEVKDFTLQMPNHVAAVSSYLNGLLEQLDAKYAFITPEFIEAVNTSFDELMVSMRKLVMDNINGISKGVWHTATGVPQVIVFIIVMLMAAFFMARDRQKLGAMIHAQLPEDWIQRAVDIKNDLFSALFGYIRAMLILMLVTFCELLVGFSIIGVDYALLFALFIAVLDAFPVLGTGTFVVPWAAYNLLTGNIRLGIGLLAVFGVVWLVRQLLEPRVVGYQIGLHPLMTLLAMYVGMRFLGVIGMILGPIVLLILRNIMRVYTKGRPLKVVLYEGVEHPPEDVLRGRAPDAQKPNVVERVEQIVIDKWHKRPKKKKG